MQQQTGVWNIDQFAQLGLPVGQYIVRLDLIEAGESNNKDPKLQFTAINMTDAANGVKAGKKHVWSYLLHHQKYTDIKNMLARDLVRAGIHGDAPLDPHQLAAFLSQQMVGHYFILSVVAQKNDPSNTNTTIAGPYNAGPQQAGPTSAPVQVAAPAPAPVAAPPAVAAPPVAAPAPPVATAAFPPVPPAAPAVPAPAAFPPAVAPAGFPQAVAAAPAPVQAAPVAAPAAQAFDAFAGV